MIFFLSYMQSFKSGKFTFRSFSFLDIYFFKLRICLKPHALDNYTRVSVTISGENFFFLCLCRLFWCCFESRKAGLPSPSCCEPRDLRASRNLPSTMKEITPFHARIPHEIWIMKTDRVVCVNRKRDWGSLAADSGSVASLWPVLFLPHSSRGSVIPVSHSVLKLQSSAARKKTP